MATDSLNAAFAVHRWSAAVSSATVPLHAGEPCGDAAHWTGLATGGCLLAIVDGLGHGPKAALAADAALASLGAGPDAPLPELMQRLDAALGMLRGAAVGLVRVEGRQLWHAGVGNTRALRLRDAQIFRLPSQNGVVGGGLPARITVTALDLQPGDWLLLFTDGLDERIDLPVQLPEWRRDPALLCLHLLGRARLGRDDAGVLVMRVDG